MLFGVDLDYTGHLIDKLLGNVEAKTDSFLVDGRVLLTDLAKHLKEVLLVFLVDPDARIKAFELYRIYNRYCYVLNNDG